MSFESTYQLVAPIADSAEALSYKAVMKMTGEEVWIHIIRADAHELFEMAQKQHAASSFGERPILEVVREGAKVYVVTRPLPPGASLGDWLKSLGQAKTPDPMQKAGAFKFEGMPVPPPPPPMSVDDATMAMPAYQAPVAAAPVFTPPPPPPAPVVVPPPVAPPPLPVAPVPVAPPPVAPLAQEPGEFTRMFKAPSAPPPAASAPIPPAPQAQGPGEFTQMFMASPPKPAASTSQMPSYVPPAPVAAPFDSLFPPAPQAPPAANPDADEFNRMFQSPLMQHTPAPINPSTNPIAPPPSQQAGEFTRMFKSVEPSSVLPTNAPPPPPPPPASAPGDFTRLLQTPSFGGSTAAPQTPQPFGASQPGATPPPPPPASSSGGAANPFANLVDGPSFSKPSLSGPTFQAPSVGMSGMSGPSISASGQISGPSMGTPTFNEGQMHAPSVSGQGFSGPSIRPQSLGGDQFSLDNLPGFGSGSAPSASPEVAPPSAGPLSSGGGAMNPNALSSPDGATAFFKAPPPPPQQHSAPPPAAGGAGDFTRMMQAPPVASAPAVGVPVPQSNAPAANAAPLFS
ncbi:MAG: hypothetical protein NTW74_09730, partial [Acidobacteria bacterium]|nr:hypothetical protein [Acidobacteriota bacterium]